MEKILVIAAHPDDEIYGMGGTIAKLSAQGKEVYLLIVTDGSTAQYRNDPNINEIIENKKLETISAAKSVGIKEIYYGNLHDMRLDITEHIAINQVIENLIQNLRPDTVFTHFWGDVNLDHIRVNESTLVATRPVASQCVKEIYCYSVPSSTEWQANGEKKFTPNYYVDIGDFVQQKNAAIMAYTTELRDFPHPRSVEAVALQDKAAGLRCGVAAAEEFILMRKIEK